MRRNPDENIRDLQRAAWSSGSSQEWDRYFAAMIRAGLLHQEVRAVIDTFGGSYGGEVTQEQAIWLMKLHGYFWRNENAEQNRADTYVELRRWPTHLIHNALFGGSKFPKTLSGYYWICNYDDLTATMFYPFRILSTAEALERTGNRRVAHRIYFMCQVCEKEIPVGRLFQHFDAKSHQ